MYSLHDKTAPHINIHIYYKVQFQYMYIYPTLILVFIGQARVRSQFIQYNSLPPHPTTMNLNSIRPKRSTVCHDHVLL